MGAPLARKGTVSFTPRQRDVLSLLVGGLGNREIAQRLGVSEADVKAIVARMLRRLGVRTRAALAASAAVMDVTGLDLVPRLLHRQLLRESPVMLAVLDGPEHEFVMANVRFAERAAKPLIGRRLAEVFPDPRVTALAGRAFATGETISEPAFRAEWRGADGAFLDAVVDLVVHPLRDERGAVGAIALFAIETPPCTVGVVLSDAQRALLEAMPAGVLVVDASRRIVLANARALEMLGERRMPATLDELDRARSTRDATGRTLSVEELPSARALRGADCPAQRFDVMSHDGQSRSLLVSATPLRATDGSVSGAMVMLSALPEA